MDGGVVPYGWWEAGAFVGSESIAAVSSKFLRMKEGGLDAVLSSVLERSILVCR